MSSHVLKIIPLPLRILGEIQAFIKSYKASRRHQATRRIILGAGPR